MAKILIPIDKAIAVRRKAGSTITFLNKDAANSVYYSREEDQLNTVAAGAVPEGTEMKAGDQLQWPSFPGTVWFRAAVQTVLDVVP